MASKREAIIALFKSGMEPPKIAERLKSPRSTVFQTIKRFQELGSSEDRSRSGRPRTVNTAAVRNKLRLRLKRNPRRSLRNTARDLNMKRETVRLMA